MAAGETSQQGGYGCYNDDDENSNNHVLSVVTRSFIPWELCVCVLHVEIILPKLLFLCVLSEPVDLFEISVTLNLILKYRQKCNRKRLKCVRGGF